MKMLYKDTYAAMNDDDDLPDLGPAPFQPGDRVYVAPAKMEADRLLVKSLLDRGEFLDEDGYPTDDALTIVEKWHWDDPKGWFKFIENIWYLRSWGWGEGVADHEWQKDTQVYLYEISTAGWSGNESLIHAMMKNDMLWNTTWVQSRRGGHYIFEVDRDEQTN